MAQHVSQPASQHVSRHGSRLVVYTAVLGGDRRLREVPLAVESSADFVCFTDDPALRSDTWEVLPVEPRLPTDPVRSERYLKIVGHPALAGYDRSLWVDPAVELREPPESFVDAWLEEADVAAPLHTFYRSVLAELQASIDRGKDDHLRVFEQLAHYLPTARDVLEANPHWTALLARRRTPEVDAAMTTWWEHVLRYSSRDQLSFGVVVGASGLRLHSVPLPNVRSPLHHWPDGWATRAEDGPADIAVPAVARKGGRHLGGPAAVRAELDEVLGDGQDPDSWIWDLEARMTRATANVRRLRSRLEEERARRSGTA